MRNLLNFLIKYNTAMLFLVLEIVSITLLMRGNKYQSSVYMTSANQLAGNIYGAWDKVTGYFALRSANNDLTVRNAELIMENERLRNIISENDSSLINAAKRQVNTKDYNIVGARVVNNSVLKQNNLITINKGSYDGVLEESGVISGTGVVGIVYVVGKHNSIVLPVLNPNSSISCKIKRTSYLGFLNWNGESANHAVLKDMPRHSLFELGDTIVTSGHSAVFPEGVPVGVITEAEESRDGLSYILDIKMFTDFARLQDVVVIDKKERVEQKALSKKVEHNN